MSIAGPVTRFAVMRALWRRAPLWRFVVLSTGLLMFLTLLFPPELASIANRGAPVQKDDVSYTRPPDPVERSATLPAAAAVTHPLPRAAVATPPIPGAPVKTAQLTLATPGNQTAGASAAGIDAALLGRTYQHEILMNGFKVPLPPGEWALLASFKIYVILNPQNTGMSYFAGRIEKGRLVGALVVNALRSPAEAPTGFDEFKNCSNPDNIYTSKEEVVAFGHQACWVMNSYFTPPWQQWGDKAMKMENIVRAAAGDLAAKGVTYPQDLISVHFFRSEKWGTLNATYFFSPEQDSIQSNVAPTFRDSDWFGQHAQRFPEKVAYLDRLKGWGEAFWPQFKSAFDAGQ